MKDQILNLERQKSLQSRRHVFILDGTIVIAYNSDKPYAYHLITETNVTRLRHQHLPTYESINIPYLCATPAIPDYSGAILGRLKQTETQYPIVCIAGKYKLEPSLAQSWLSLENILEDMAQLLISSSQPFVPIDYRFPPTPSSYGFLRDFESRYDAVVAAQKSRDAFQGLIAHASWGAILHRARDMAKRSSLMKNDKTRKSPYDISREDTSVFDAGWKTVLANPSFGIHSAWIAALAHSTVGDFSIPRAGVVIRNTKDWPFMHLIPTLVLSNVPVWLVWGKFDVPTSLISWPTWTKEKFGPSAHERMRAHIWTTTPPTTDTEASKARVKSVASEEKNSDNRLPDVHAWIRKQNEYIAKKIEQASPDKRLKYAQRAAAAATFPCPGKRGAIVYEWDKDDQDRPTRTLVMRGDVERTWAMFTDSQRWYNCVAHEWELCRELAPNDVPEDDLYSDYSISDRELGSHEDADFNLSLTDGWRKKSIATDAFSMSLRLTEHLPQSELRSEASDSATHLGEVEIDAMLILSKRLGFAYHRLVPFQTVSKMQWTLTKALRVIGDSKEKATYRIPEGVEAAAIQFIMYLDAVGHPNIRTSDIPSSLCDIYGGNICSLMLIKSSVFIQTISDGNHRLHIIHHEQEKDRPWLLAVSDPCTALQAVRSDPPTLNDFVLCLINSRTPFRTLRRADSMDAWRNDVPHRKYTRRRIGLGRRPIGHKLDKADYIVYKAEQSRLLESQRVSRAAIKRGGIVSRLVHGMVDDCYILNGPSPEAPELPFRFVTMINGERVSFYDDDISDEEISILVGLYSIKAGRYEAP